MSIFKKKSNKEIGYISAKTSRAISKFNRKVTKKLEKEREDAGKDPALYTTTMKDANGGLKAAYCSDQYVHLTSEGAAAWVKVLKVYSEN